MKYFKIIVAILAVLILFLCVFYYYENIRPSYFFDPSISYKYPILNIELNLKDKKISSETPDEWYFNGEVIKTGRNVAYCGPRKVAFQEYLSHRDPQMLGGFGSIHVIDCGDNYFVHIYTDAGPKLFGPFSDNSNLKK